MRDVSATLVRQILRGSSDEQMLNKLRLDEQDPVPEYPDLIVKVRREEARRTERRLRLKQAARRTTTLLDSSMESQAPQTPSKPTPEKPQTIELDSKLTQLRQRVAQLETNHSNMFCFRCGEDGHLAYDCQGTPNKVLVEEKKSKRKPHHKRSRNAHVSEGQCRRQGIIPDDLIGGTPEIYATFNNIQCKALLDTGSQITTVSNTFYNRI